MEHQRPAETRDRCRSCPGSEHTKGKAQNKGRHRELGQRKATVPPPPHHHFMSPTVPSRNPRVSLSHASTPRCAVRAPRRALDTRCCAPRWPDLESRRGWGTAGLEGHGSTSLSVQHGHSQCRREQLLTWCLHKGLGDAKPRPLQIGASLEDATTSGWSSHSPSALGLSCIITCSQSSQ